MKSRSIGAIALVGLSACAMASTLSSQTAFAQGPLGRLRNRLEGENQNNSQQNSGQSSQQQQYQGGQPNQQQQYQGGQQYQNAPMGAPQAQAGGGEVSVVTLQTQQGPGGSQMVVTPRGMVVPLPGPGVNSNTVQVYIGGQGGYWYTDRNGQQVDLTPAVHAMQQSMGGQGQAAANVPQYAPQPQVVNNYNEPQQTSSSGGSGASAVGTAAAAGLGAMAGSAIGSSMYYNNVPYGTPIHYGAAGAPYYNNGGKPVYINNSSNTANFNQVNNQHATALAQQQNWYKQQQTTQSSQYQNWQKNQTANNPFVRSEYQNAQGGAAGAAGEARAAGATGDARAAGAAGDARAAGGAGGAAAASGEAGRFGRGSEGEGGGRFGKSAEAGEGGGRFGRGEAGGEGGRFGRGNGGEGRGLRRGNR